MTLAPDTVEPGMGTEKLAFNFCKAGTIMLITWPLGRFALPVVAAVAASLFLLARLQGCGRTRCFLRSPLLAGVFWVAVCALSLAGAWRHIIAR